MRVVTLTCLDDEIALWEIGARLDQQSLRDFIRESVSIMAEAGAEFSDDISETDLEKARELIKRIERDRQRPRKNPGRPQRNFDPTTVRAALEGRSVRGAARALGVPHETLRRWIYRQESDARGDPGK